MEGVKIFACRRPVKRRDTASGNFLNFCVPQREREIAQAAADTLPAAPTSIAMPAKCCHAPNAKASTGRSVTNPSYFVCWWHAPFDDFIKVGTRQLHSTLMLAT
jgi:hypothetical protein